MTLKKITLLGSGALSVCWFILGSANYKICDIVAANGHLGTCPYTVAAIETIISPVLLFFLFSIATYFMREEIFKTWVRFAFPWIVFTVLLAWITPNTGGGYLSMGTDQAIIGLGMILSFIIISLVIILWKLFTIRPKKVR